MSEIGNDIDPFLAQLVLSLQAGAMQQMGKVASPFSGEIERDLQMAKVSIDMLAMVETKTKGNLTDDEAKMLTGVLYNLRLNFVEESKKPEESTESTPSEETEKSGESDKADSEDKPENGEK